MPNVYADLAQFRARFLENQPADAFDENAVELCLEDASRRVDRHTNRTYYAQTGARIFDGPGRDPTTQDYLYWAQLYTQRLSFSFIRILDCLAATSAALDI